MKLNYPALKRISVFCMQVVVYTTVVLASVFHASCRATSDGIQMVSGDYTAPELVSFTVISQNELEVTFSKQIILENAAVADTGKADCKVPVSVKYSEDNMHAQCILSADTVTGKDYTFSGSVRDASENTLSFSFPFRGYNAKVPRIIFSEIQEGTSRRKGLKYEFVEIYVLQAGNLSGLKLSSTYDGEDRSYMLPAVDVRAGEYITIHMRTDETAHCVDELGDNLTESAGYASSNSRDLWVQNTKACFGSSGDVIQLINSNDGTLMDAVVYIRDSLADWPKAEMGKAAAAASECGLWFEGGDVSHALRVPGKSGAVFLVRKNLFDLTYKAEKGKLPGGSIPASSADWVQIKSADATPGRPNI